MIEGQTWELILTNVAADDDQLTVIDAPWLQSTWAKQVTNRLTPLGVATAVVSTAALLSTSNLRTALTPNGTVWEQSPDDALLGAGIRQGVLIAPDRSLVGQWSWGGDVDAEEVVTAVEEAVLSRWAHLCGIGLVRITDRYRPGADSALIARVETDQGPLVAKVGPSTIVSSEVDFVRRVTQELGSETSFFPKVVGMIVDDPIAAVFMEAANPATLDEALFLDEQRTELGANSIAILRPFLDSLRALHEATDAPGKPESAEYVYFGRFEMLPTHPDFVTAARNSFPEIEHETLVSSDWIGPDGERVRGLSKSVEMLREVAYAVLPHRNSTVHGDAHLKNMLRAEDGSPVFIDPRTIWDGNRRTDEGRGDPAYDFATLFHSIWPMSTILHAVETGSSGTPFSDFSVRDGAVRFRGACPDSAHYSKLERKFVELISCTGGIGTEIAKARLYIGTANALIGWLRYPKALPTRDSWGSTFFATVKFLELGLQAIERSISNDATV